MVKRLYGGWQEASCWRYGTLELIHRMRDRLVKGSKMQSYKDELTLDWHDDMIWWGPGGIGASYTID